jgi:hypothetical protein
VNPRRTWTALFACATALLLVAPSASAKPGYFVFPGHHSITFSLSGSHDYRIHVERQGRQVFLLASDNRSVAAYLTRSPAPEGDEIKARFPGVGRVSVRFRPLGLPRTDTSPFFPGCKGGEIIKQSGYFVGTIRFHGERGYTKAVAKRARGTIETAGREVCKRSLLEDSDSDSDPNERTELLARSESGAREISFSASSMVISDRRSFTSFSASVGERRRGMRIFRHIFVTGGRRDIAPGDTRPSPLSATVTPPAPFQGSAEFQRDAEGNSTWTGSLTVPFPGLGRVALTGPDFTARLCQPPGCTGSGGDGHRLGLRSRSR